jgi:hypothetical protein
MKDRKTAISSPHIDLVTLSEYDRDCFIITGIPSVPGTTSVGPPQESQCAMYHHSICF